MAATLPWPLKEGRATQASNWHRRRFSLDAPEEYRTMGNLCARIPNAVPKAQASPAFPQSRHYDKNAWPTQAGFSHTSAVPICPNQTEQVYSPIFRHLTSLSQPA
jgi:hypothetical protein